MAFLNLATASRGLIPGNQPSRRRNGGGRRRLPARNERPAAAVCLPSYCCVYRGCVTEVAALPTSPDARQPEIDAAIAALPPG